MGALVAALMVHALIGELSRRRPSPPRPCGALLIELLFTFALALVVLNSAASARTHGNSFYGIAIGFTIVVAAAAGGPISGGAFNPAVGIGAILVNAALGGDTWAISGSIWWDRWREGRWPPWSSGCRSGTGPLHAEPSQTTGEPAGVAAGLERAGVGARRTGVRAAVGGRHQDGGTRNAQPAAAPAG